MKDPTNDAGIRTAVAEVQRRSQTHEKMIDQWRDAIKKPAEDPCICSEKLLTFLERLSNEELRHLMAELSMYPPGQYPNQTRRLTRKTKEEKKERIRAYAKFYRARKNATMTEEEKEERRKKDRERYRRQQEAGGREYRARKK